MLADGTIEAFRLQSGFCERFDSPLYAEFLARAADDIEAGGPIADVLDGWQGLPMADALPLRLLGAAHRMVLEGTAPQLARFYPTAGGTPHMPDAWLAFSDLVRARADEFRAGLARQVQTNEIRRSAALLGGFLALANEHGLPLRGLEIGSSAGLNQRWHRYRYELAACEPDRPPPVTTFRPAWGDPAAAVVVRCGWNGDDAVLRGRVQVASMAGCDIAPIDLADVEQARTLEAFVWADHVERLGQLRTAIAAARCDPPRIMRRAAADWLAEQLDPSVQGVISIVFHSIMWWYLSEDERTRVTETIAAAGKRATRAAPVAWLRLEMFGTPKAELRLTSWPGGLERTLARADPQGRWVTWLSTCGPC